MAADCAVNCAGYNRSGSGLIELTAQHDMTLTLLDRALLDDFQVVESTVLLHAYKNTIVLFHVLPPGSAIAVQ